MQNNLDVIMLVRDKFSRQTSGSIWVMIWTKFEVDGARETTRWDIGVVEEDVCEDCCTQQRKTGEDDEYSIEIGA